MTRLALGAKWGRPGGEGGRAAAGESAESSLAKAAVPIRDEALPRNVRRFSSDDITLDSLPAEGFIEIENHTRHDG